MVRHREQRLGLSAVAATQLCRVFTADEDVANAVQPHPHLPVLATSGIESTVKVGGCPCPKLCI